MLARQDNIGWYGQSRGFLEKHQEYLLSVGLWKKEQVSDKQHEKIFFFRKIKKDHLESSSLSNHSSEPT